MALYCRHCYEKDGELVRVPVDDPTKTSFKCPRCGKFVDVGKGKTGYKVNLPFVPKSAPKGDSTQSTNTGGGGGEGGGEPPKEESQPKVERGKVILKKISGHGISSRTMSAIIVGAIFSLSLLVPYLNIMTKALREFILDLLVIPFPNIPNTWPAIWAFFSVLTTVIAVLWAWTKDSIWVGIIWMLFLVCFMTAYYFIPPILDRLGAGEFLPSLMCTLQNLGKEGGMTECLSGQLEEEEIEKIGDYDVLQVRFDTETTEERVHKDRDTKRLLVEDYFINLEITNPSDTDTVEGFKILSCADYNCVSGSYIRRGGSVASRDRIKFGALWTIDGMYMDDGTGVRCPNNDCSIGPGETLLIALQGVPFTLCDGVDESSCEKFDVCRWDEDADPQCFQVEDTKSTYLDAKIMFSYDYETEGKYDFIVTTSDQVLRPLLRNRMPPQSSAGPLDVEIKFGPTAYVFRDPSQTEAEVIVRLTLSKEDDGNTAYIKRVKINKLDFGLSGEPVLSAPQVCTAPWLGGVELENGELLIDDGSGGEPLKKSHTYTCRYTIDRDAVDEDGEVIPFISVAEYRYEKTILNRFIEVADE